MESLVTALENIINSFQENFIFLIGIIGLLWFIHLINKISGFRLNYYFGIWPRKIKGLLGIFTSPFLHGNFNHLFFNSIPLFILAAIICTESRILFYQVTFEIAVISGFAVWLFGKRGIYIGASGVIMGYFGFLLAMAYYKPSINAIILGILTLYYLGGLIYMLFPSEKKEVTWAGHIFGFLAGILVAYIHYRFNL